MIKLDLDYTRDNWNQTTCVQNLSLTSERH